MLVESENFIIGGFMKTVLKKGIMGLIVLSTLALFFGCSDSKTLLFQKNGQIFKEYENGKDAVMLISKGEYPQWIPGTKTHFAYVERQPGNPHMKLWVAKEDGTNPLALTNFEVSYAFSWSPDGKWIAISHTKDGNYEIYKIKIDGTTLTRLTNNSFTDYYPAWSPKGDKIAFISARSGHEGIYVINPDGTNEKRVTPATLLVLSNVHSKLSWSPDGKKIAFVGRWGTNYNIGTVDVQTGTTTQLSKKGGASNPLWYDKYIFYFCYNDLYLYDTSTNKTTNLGWYVAQTQQSALSADAVYVFFSYGANAPNPPHIYRVKYHAGGAEDIGQGSWPDVW